MAHDADEDGENDDIVRVLLDPFQDKRSAYVFFVNPRGARSEGLVYPGTRHARLGRHLGGPGRIPEHGWSAESNPLQDDLLQPGFTVWGINVERYIAQETGNDPAFRHRPRQPFFNNPMEAAALEGIEGIRQGTGITFRPYGLIAPRRPPGGAGGAMEAGLRFRPLQEFHSQPRGRLQLQHRFRRDRSR